jgi:hypothetical protein
VLLRWCGKDVVGVGVKAAARHSQGQPPRGCELCCAASWGSGRANLSRLKEEEDVVDLTGEWGSSLREERGERPGAAVDLEGPWT